MLALHVGCGPIVVVAGAVEADAFAREQGMGDQGDGQVCDRLERTVGAGDGELKDGLRHIISLGMVRSSDYRRRTRLRVDKGMQRSLKLLLPKAGRLRSNFGKSL